MNYKNPTAEPRATLNQENLTTELLNTLSFIRENKEMMQSILMDSCITYTTEEKGSITEEHRDNIRLTYKLLAAVIAES